MLFLVGEFSAETVETK